MARVVTLSSRAVGSSAIRSDGPAAIARASATRSRSPAESRATARSAWSASPTTARASIVRSCSSTPSTPRSASASSTFSRAVSALERPGTWPTTPIDSRRKAARASRSRAESTTSPTTTSPSSGVSRPASSARSVDFPEPEGPVTTVSVPGSKVASTRSRAVSRPKRRDTPRASMRAPAAVAGASGTLAAVGPSPAGRSSITPRPSRTTARSPIPAA